MSEVWVIVMLVLSIYAAASLIKTYGDKISVSVKKIIYFSMLAWLLFWTVVYFNDTTDTFKHVLKIILAVGLGGFIIYKIKMLTNGKKANE